MPIRARNFTCSIDLCGKKNFYGILCIANEFYIDQPEECEVRNKYAIASLEQTGIYSQILYMVNLRNVSGGNHYVSSGKGNYTGEYSCD